ncbi:MAG TPA: hypothetical protein VLZ74_17200 [Methylocella sp.]|nr:hypothetical protein [Methylocella sp.]
MTAVDACQKAQLITSGLARRQAGIHRYVWRVEALDKNGKVLARTLTEGSFPMH